MRFKQWLKKWQRNGKDAKIFGIFRVVSQLYHLPRQTRDFFRRNLVRQRLLETLGERDPDALVALAQNDFGGVLKPLQIDQEFRQLIRRAAGIKPHRILEIGTANGATLFALTRVAADGATIVSVDLPGGLWGGGYPRWKQSLYKAFARPGQTMHLFREDSHSQRTFEKVRSVLGDRQVDVLFIDGDHTYEGVKQDFELYRSLVRPGGLVVFHDVAEHGDKNVQVDRFWREIKASGKLSNCEEYVQSHTQGWAGIGVGEFVA